MKTDRLALLILLLFLVITVVQPIANDSISSRESTANHVLDNSWPNADYTVYRNESKFFAMNGKLQEVELENEDFSELLNEVFSLAKDGATITISPGEYSVSATLKVTKFLHIYAYGVTFQVNASLTPIAIQIGDRDNSIFSPHSLKGVKIINVGKKGLGTGILLYNSHFGSLEDLEIWFFDIAIHSKGSWDYNIKNCILRVNKVGIKLSQDDEGINRSNQFKISAGYIGCDIGIYITANCQNVMVETVNICDSSEQGAGIWIEQAEHTVVRDCYFENNPNMDIKIGSGESQAKATQIEDCYFLVKETAIKIENAYYTRVEGCMAINHSGNDSALFIDMTEKALRLICTHNYLQNLGSNLFFGLDGNNVEWSN